MADDHLHHEDLAGQVPSDPALRIKALESLLVELGLVDPATIDAWIESFEKRIGPHNGAKIVARAWVDPDYKQRLLANGAGAIGEMNLLGSQGQHIVSWRTHPSCTTLSSVPCAHAIRGRCSGCHRDGTNRRRIDRGPS
jgi:nitrile hydratase